ncbi:apolipoprotein N-acyltransferase [bacterium]|nr:apolipoprotein N-acyltransferase [bacterium]
MIKARPPYQLLALTLASGFLYFLSIPPFALVWPAWFVWLPLLWGARRATSGQAFLLGWLAGSLGSLGGLWFMVGVISTHSTIPVPLAVILTALMAMQQGMGVGLWLGLARRLHDRVPTWLLYPTLYVAVESFYPTVFSLHLGDCQSGCLWTRQCFDLTGPGGLTFVIVGFHVALWRVLEGYAREAVVGVAMLMASLIYGWVRVGQVERQMAQAGQPLRVAMIQNDIGTPKTAEQMIEGLHRLQKMAAAVASSSQPDLIVFPETAVRTPPPMHRVEGESLMRVASVRRYPIALTYLAPDFAYSPQSGFRVPLLFGAMSEDETHDGPIAGRTARYNAAFLLDGQGNVLGRALKNKLLLGGEYIPGAAYFPWLYTKVLTRASLLSAGTKPAVLPLAGKNLGISICYEDTMPAQSYQLARQNPQLLVNLTNDAWFGKSSEPAAHLAVSAARCIELRLYMVRSTATGISAFIDPLGRIVSQSQPDGPQTLLGDVAWMPGGTVFSRLGLSFSWLCGILSALWLVQARRSASRSFELMPTVKKSI